MSLLTDVEDAVRLGLVPAGRFMLRDGRLLRDRRGVYHSRQCSWLPKLPALHEVRKDILSLVPSKRCICVIYPQQELTSEREELLASAQPLVRLWRSIALAERISDCAQVGDVPLVLSEATLALEASPDGQPLADSLRAAATGQVERLESLLASAEGSRALLDALRGQHWSRDTLVWGEGVSVVDVSVVELSPRHVDAHALWVAFGREHAGRRLVILPLGAAPLVRTAFPGDAQAFPVADVGVIPDLAFEVFLTLWDPHSTGAMRDPLQAVEAARLVMGD